MNEKLRTLVKRAGGHFDTHNLASNPVQYRESIELWDDRIQKFAELIINECAEIAKHNVMNISTYADAEFVDKQIKEHFGVE
jgi:hypothetical protein